MIKYVTWDIETLINLSTWCFKDLESGKKKQFILYDDFSQFTLLIEFLNSLKKHNYTLIGFNSINFDAQILECLLRNKNNLKNIGEVISKIYAEAQRIVSLKDFERFDSLIPEWKLTHKHVDLFKQKHYDGAAKRGTSLKWIQFSTCYENIEEMPISHDSFVKPDEIPMVLSYNWNDVDSTENFFKLIRFETDLRKSLSEKYQLNLINASEPRMAKEIFAKFLSEDMGIDKYKLKQLRTKRDYIEIKDIIFPYVGFKTPELNTIKKEFESWIVNPNIPKKKGQYEQTFTYNGAKTVVGLGGIHGCIKPGVYNASKRICIHDIDVVSFYPNLAIQNDLKPEHLGKSFNNRYNDIFQQRKSIPKSDPINYVFKIILNSSYGLSKEINSYLYDPLFTFSITVNGQLLLLMLAEELLAHIPNVIFYQLNTDGITIGYDKELYADKIQEILDNFCKLTKLEVEEVFYKSMIIRDVNNYIAVYDKEGKEPKRKGIFEPMYGWDNKRLVDYHKNPSFNVITLALEQHFVHGKDYREFIFNHDNFYDFCAATKKKSDFKLNYYIIRDGKSCVEEQQKVTRYFVSSTGGILMKDYKDGRQIAVESQVLITPCNKLNTELINTYFKNIDYYYYINSAKDIIETIEIPKIQFKLAL